jgi:hypothetical protein
VLQRRLQLAVGEDNDARLVWLEGALDYAFMQRKPELWAYLEAVMEGVLFEIELESQALPYGNSLEQFSDALYSPLSLLSGMGEFFSGCPALEADLATFVDALRGRWWPRCLFLSGNPLDCT